MISSPPASERSRPPLPDTIAGRITDYRARNVADWVMYRKALASAAEARGWPVHWYDAKKVVGSACQALRIESFDAHFLHMRRAVGPPWNLDHKLAMAAAVATHSSSILPGLIVHVLGVLLFFALIWPGGARSLSPVQSSLCIAVFGALAIAGFVRLARDHAPSVRVKAAA